MIIYRLYDFLSRGKHLFTTIKSQKVVYEIALTIIEIADQLKLSVEEQNIQFLETGGDAYFDRGELNIVFLRNGKREYYCFPEQIIDIHKTNSTSCLSDLKLEGPPDEDGFTHYIYSSPTEPGYLPYAIYISKKEALFLEKRVDEVSKEEYGFNFI